MNVQELRDKLAPYRDCETNINSVVVDGTKKLVTLTSEPVQLAKPATGSGTAEVKKVEVKK